MIIIRSIVFMLTDRNDSKITGSNIILIEIAIATTLGLFVDGY